MTPGDLDRLEELYLAAAELAPEEREPFLDEACRGNPELRREVEKLLAVGEEADVLSGASPETLAVSAATGSAPEEVGSGATVGQYRILEQVGEGGFGVVYRAEQLAPVRRRVGLKLIKPGMDSRAVVARFEAERQALALMDHDHIARIFDGGLTPDGRPFFAMEFVQGIPITEYCDRERLGTRDRLRLIQQTCHGVQHAHQKGVIHRDLKPANILVELQGKEPVVKIIDFGVAKAIGQQLTEKTLFTARGQIIGTLHYMSPEQVSGSGLDIDTRSDVYALGAVLYEVLTGKKLFDFGRKGFDEMVRTIREDEPRRPSTRITTLGDQRASAAERRGTDPRTLSRELRADLDWITMKALDKDRNRRYASASDLAEDIERHLTHEPVLAGPPSTVYRLKKFVRKNRALVSSLGAIGAVLVGALIVTLDLNRRLEVARREAVASAKDARRERDSVMRLSAAQKLLDLQQEADAFWPVAPEMAGDMRAWLDRARELVRGLESDPDGDAPGHYKQLATIRGRAHPQTPEERAEERRLHPRLHELETLEVKLAALVVAHEVRRGRAEPTPFELDAASLSADLSEIAKQVTSWVHPERSVFGREAEGLARARVVRQRAADDELGTANVLYAWALFANGLDDEAVAAAREALEHASPDQKSFQEDVLAKLREAVETARGPEGEREIAALRAETAALDAVVSARRNFRFGDDDDRWWHTRLADLVEGIEAFMDPETGLLAGVSPRFGWGIERRLAFAETVGERTLTGPDAAARWDEAIASIRDEARCPAYGGLELPPQLGLLPIGRDPASGLWEFAHVMSGAVPARDEAGRLAIDEETCVVLVLLPGGTFTIGAQSSATDRRNYDPQAQPDEGPPRELTLTPFFLSKYEMTQGQWRRFTGDNPSAYGPDEDYNPIWNREKLAPTRLHPVERVSRDDCARVLPKLGLALPTEVQWEFAARAGAEEVELNESVNVLDQHYRTHGGLPDLRYAEWDDGHTVHAPAGTFPPNGFGLHETLGNVSEWCRDGYDQRFYSHCPNTDPLSDPEASSRGVFRGGAFQSATTEARVSQRGRNLTDYTDPIIGVRPARAIAR